MSSTITRTPLVFEQATPVTLADRAVAYARASGARRGQRLVGAIDPWWLAVVGAGLVALLLVSGWPDRAGAVSDALILALAITIAVAVLVYATRQAEAQLGVNQLRAT